MKKLIATHNKMFHADEVTAIALLEVFTDFEIEVERVEHDCKDFSKYDFVIDIGKKYDGIKYFDHHQYKGGKSSAGLIWEYLDLSHEYPKLSKLIDLVDRNDVGIEKAKPFEFSSLIKCYNSRNLLSEEQDEQFYQAVNFSKNIILSMKEMEEGMIKVLYFHLNERANLIDDFNNNRELICNMSSLKIDVSKADNWSVDKNSFFKGLTSIPVTKCEIKD